jgi:hypothetical protein
LGMSKPRRVPLPAATMIAVAFIIRNLPCDADLATI